MAGGLGGGYAKSGDCGVISIKMFTALHNAREVDGQSAQLSDRPDGRPGRAGPRVDADRVAKRRKPRRAEFSADPLRAEWRGVRFARNSVHSSPWFKGLLAGAPPFR